MKTAKDPAIYEILFNLHVSELNKEIFCVLHVSEVGHWEDEYPDCGKNGQSPINIETDDVIPDRHLRRFSFSNNFLQTLDSTLLENTGHGC